MSILSSPAGCTRCTMPSRPLRLLLQSGKETAKRVARDECHNRGTYEGPVVSCSSILRAPEVRCTRGARGV